MVLPEYKTVLAAGQNALHDSAAFMPGRLCTGKKWPSQLRTQKAFAGLVSARCCGGLPRLAKGSAKAVTEVGARGASMAWRRPPKIRSKMPCAEAGVARTSVSRPRLRAPIAALLLR